MLCAIHFTHAQTQRGLLSGARLAAAAFAEALAEAAALATAAGTLKVVTAEAHNKQVGFSAQNGRQQDICWHGRYFVHTAAALCACQPVTCGIALV